LVNITVYGHLADTDTRLVVYFCNNTDTTVNAVYSGRDRLTGSLLTDKAGGACLSLYAVAGIPEEVFGIFLDAFGKLLKATVSFVMSVGLSAWINSSPTGRIFLKFYI
jgi:hypothetical protein